MNDKYLYVSDGRSATRTSASSSSCGGVHEHLLLRRERRCEHRRTSATALALARSELGVEITFDRKVPRVPSGEGRPDQFADCACAVGRIRYTRPAVIGEPQLGIEPEVKEQPGLSQDGYLVYAPTVITSDDAVGRCTRSGRPDAAFPHHSTVDQLFTDQKFEAYRVLGRHAALKAMKTMDEALAAPVASDGGDAEERETGDVREALANLLRALGS